MSELELIVSNTKTNIKNEITNTEEALAKIAITKEADRNLIEILNRVNSEFEAGRVSKQDMLSWIVLKFAKDVSENDIENIRVDHFDEMAYFDFLYKRAKKTGVVPVELKKAMLSTVSVDNSKGLKVRVPKKKSVADE